jgi:hypothetical protein
MIERSSVLLGAVGEALEGRRRRILLVALGDPGDVAGQPSVRRLFTVCQWASKKT